MQTSKLASSLTEGYELRIRTLLDEGQFFLAYDLSLQALKENPENILLTLLAALALINNGATSKALELISPITEKLETPDIQAKQLQHLFAQCFSFAQETQKINNQINSNHLQTQITQTMIDFAQAVQRLNVVEKRVDQLIILKLAAEVYYKFWQNTQKLSFLITAETFSLECFRLDKSIADGIRAAILFWVNGEFDTAKELAKQVISYCNDLISMGNESCQDLFAIALSELLLNQNEKSFIAYQNAMKVVDGRYTLIVDEKKRLDILKTHGLNIDPSIEKLLKSPEVVIFGGQPIDPKNNEFPIFPPHIELSLSVEISKALDKIDAQIAYSSAACGSDILFIEAMLNRGAEVNIILPFCKKDFLSACICYAGKKWERRFHNVLKLATTVTWSTSDPYLQDNELFRYNNLLILGKAMLRAETLLTTPQLLVAMDNLAPKIPGSSADFMAQWADNSRLCTIDLKQLREKANAIESNNNNILAAAESNHHIQKSQKNPLSQARKIKAMLFADIVHYSKLNEEQLPLVFQFLDEVKQYLLKNSQQAELVESWGDALYVAMTGAMAMADYAFHLCYAMDHIDYKAFGLKERPELRIGLHVGPVYESIHPLTQRKIIFGQHVSRAARIEPITIPGEIFTSEHFVAVLKAEENVARHLALSSGEVFIEKYIPEYVGIIPLPKNFGHQAIYHLRQLDD